MKTIDTINALKNLLDARATDGIIRTAGFSGDHSEDSEAATGDTWLENIQAGEYTVPGHGHVRVIATWPASADGYSILVLRGGLAVAWVNHRSERVCISVGPMRGGTAHSIRVQWVEPGVSDQARRDRKHAERVAAQRLDRLADAAATALHALSEAGRDDLCLTIVRGLVGGPSAVVA